MGEEKEDVGISKHKYPSMSKQGTEIQNEGLRPYDPARTRVLDLGSGYRRGRIEVRSTLPVVAVSKKQAARQAGEAGVWPAGLAVDKCPSFARIVRLRGWRIAMDRSGVPDRDFGRGL